MSDMTVSKVQIERLRVTSSKPFDTAVAALEAAVAHPDIIKVIKEAGMARTFAEMENTFQRAAGGAKLMLFMRFDLGAILQKESGLRTPKLLRFLIGNPLIMKEMTKHVPDAGSYAPVTVLVEERPDGVHFSYDRMASLLAPYGSSEALTVARDLDATIEKLILDAAG